MKKNKQSKSIVNYLEKTKEAVDEFEMFLVSDLPSKIFPMDRTLGETMFREDYFETKKQVEDYIEDHFKIFRKQLKTQKDGETK